MALGAMAKSSNPMDDEMEMRLAALNDMGPPVKK